MKGYPLAVLASIAAYALPCPPPGRRRQRGWSEGLALPATHAGIAGAWCGAGERGPLPSCAPNLRTSAFRLAFELV